ncbi:hypothetical protein LSTR_LSTR002225 [Laodelphax striatellus]|uniref:Regulatory protein zeste n=1 Tax=Laodelphax striatellus TaxID=195883 RepID=A0A482XFG1_LAOST|nr:hypothetical protein LSTR_LSTR002225 [Laodelphax striatellus]
METISISKRARNFTERESNLIMSLVKKYQVVLENKKTTAVALREKEETWKKISDEFNQLSWEVSRDWKALRGRYKNMKGAHKRRAIRPRPITEIDLKVLEIIAPQWKGRASVFNSDQSNGKVPDVQDAEEKMKMQKFLSPNSSEAPEDDSPNVPEKSGKNTTRSQKRSLMQNTEPALLGNKTRKTEVEDYGRAGSSTLSDAEVRKWLQEDQRMARERHDLKIAYLKAEKELMKQELFLKIEERRLNIEIKKKFLNDPDSFKGLCVPGMKNYQ